MRLIPIAAGVVVAFLAMGGHQILTRGAFACGVTQADAQRYASSLPVLRADHRGYATGTASAPQIGARELASSRSPSAQSMTPDRSK